MKGFLGMAAASLVMAAGVNTAYSAGPVYQSKPERGRRRRVAPPKRAKLPFDPRINRWTGEPHEHKREIARGATQFMARTQAQSKRGFIFAGGYMFGISRRGLIGEQLA